MDANPFFSNKEEPKKINSLEGNKIIYKGLNYIPFKKIPPKNMSVNSNKKKQEKKTNSFIQIQNNTIT